MAQLAVTDKEVRAGRGQHDVHASACRCMRHPHNTSHDLHTLVQVAEWEPKIAGIVDWCVFERPTLLAFCALQPA